MIHVLAFVFSGVLCLTGDPPTGGIPGGRAPSTLDPFTQEISGTTVTIDMVPIPAGSITIADAKVKGQVETINIPEMWVSTTEITWDAYDIYLFKLDQVEGEDSGADEADAITRPSKPYIPPDRGYGHAGYPVISETVKGARGFCEWLSAKTGRSYRLPTEAEWEYFARADGNLKDRFTYGDDESLLGEFAWYKANSKRKTHPVGKKKVNAWGLFDVHGNVGEWVERSDGSTTTCGGAFLHEPWQLQLTVRTYQSPLWNITDPNMPKSTWWLSDCDFVGFRIVCEGSAPTQEDEPADEEQP